MKSLNLSRRLLACWSLGPLCLLAACTTPHYDVRSIPSDGIGPPRTRRAGRHDAYWLTGMRQIVRMFSNAPKEAGPSLVFPLAIIL
jgi:hypothetical protein